MEVGGPAQAAEPVEEKKPEAASPQQAGLNISALRMEIEGTNKGRLINESWGASGTRGSFGLALDSVKRVVFCKKGSRVQ